MSEIRSMFFFFQAEDGIRDLTVTGVQTCALPISFTPEEIEAAVDEAHKWGLPIAAHAIGRTGIEHCIRAAVDSIEHGAQMSAESARQMKEKGIFHIPTISALRGIVDHPEDVPAYAVEKGKQILEVEHFLGNLEDLLPFLHGIRRHVLRVIANPPEGPDRRGREIPLFLHWLGQSGRPHTGPVG